MDTEKQTEIKPTEESQEDLLNKKVGTLEPEKLKPAKVLVKDISIQQQMKKGTDKPVGKLAIFMCKHPDKEELIKLSKVLFRKDEKESVKESGLWYNKDKEDNIQKGSPLAVLLEYNKVLTLKDLENQELETELNEAGYLCFKAY